MKQGRNWMPKVFVLTSALLLIAGCGHQETKETQVSRQEAEKVMQHVCAECHNLDMPPKTSDDEKAPPLYTVTVHLKDWMKTDDPSALRDKFISFVPDYVLHPSRKKSYCDPASLKVYGLMPSLDGQVTYAQAKAIAEIIFDRYDQMKMLALMKERNRLAALPPYRQVLETKDCRLCHIQGKGKLAPGFDEIGRKYGVQGIEKIKEAILNGSHGKWPAYHAPMRAYKDLTPKQLDGITQWIAEQK